MIDRRHFLKLAAAGGGVVFASALQGRALAGTGYDEFFFVQLSDSHWGYSGPANPQADMTLKTAVASVNALATQPDFIVFTGDLTHTTDDSAERRRRLIAFRDIVKELKVKHLRFMPGEHDASLDSGAAYKELFGETHYSFTHKGIHFVVLDNVSDPGANIGEAQLQWLRSDLARISKSTPLVVFTHRPLFDLAPAWDWATRDGAKAIDILMTHPNVTVFYGHIHQEHHQQTGHIFHHSAKSLMFPLPVAMSQPKRTPLPWDPAQPNRGLGFREVDAEPLAGRYKLQEFGVTRA